MSNCNSCKKKFALLNLDRRRCKECEQYFCYNCMPTIFGSYCKVCKILNTRPALHSSITKLRARDIKVYLTRRKVQTESYIEKEELVKCYFKYVSLEPQLKNKRAYASIKTHSNRYSSTPNLAANQRERLDDAIPHTPPARPPYTTQSDASSSSHQMSDVQMQTSQENVQSQSTATNSSAFHEEAVQATETDSNKPTNQPTNTIKLSNIQEASEIQQLTIKQLKELLILNRVNFKGCVEKDELRSKVAQLWNDSKDRPDITNLPTDELCKICMDAPLNSVLLECGHIVSCIDCGKQLAECPICRQYVVRVVHTFKA